MVDGMVIKLIIINKLGFFLQHLLKKQKIMKKKRKLIIKQIKIKNKINLMKKLLNNNKIKNKKEKKKSKLIGQLMQYNQFIKK